MKKFSKSGVLGGKNGGRFVFELLWGVKTRQKTEKLGKIRKKLDKIRKKSDVLGVI